MKPWSLLGASLLALYGCQKKEEAPKAAPAPTTPPAVSVAPIKEPEPAAAPAAPAASSAAAPVEPAPEPVARKVVPSGSVQTCCSALAAAAKEPGKNQNKYTSAASVCVGLEKALKSGKANLASTKVTLRAQLAGVPVPSGC